MAVEYVKFSNDEKSVTHSHLLQSQLSALQSVSHFRAYRDLRKEEYLLKIQLKQKVEEALLSLTQLTRSLPESSYMEPVSDQTPQKKEFLKRELSLNDEIEKIREKLQHLQGSTQS